MSKFSCFYFGNPTNKIEIGTAYTRGTTNNKPPGPIIIIDQLEILSLSQVQFITLGFWRCTTVFSTLPALTSCTNLVQKNQFPELNWHILTFTQLILLSGVTY